MAVVKGHAVRRREGLAPNTLVMAQEGSTAGRDDSVECSVGGCSTRLPRPVGPTPGDVSRQRDEYYMHALVQHPRHSNAGSAREYFRSTGRIR